MEFTLSCLACMAILLLVVLLPVYSGDTLEQFSLTMCGMTLSARQLAVTVEVSTMQFLLSQLLSTQSLGILEIKNETLDTMLEFLHGIQCWELKFTWNKGFIFYMNIKHFKNHHGTCKV